MKFFPISISIIFLFFFVSVCMGQNKEALIDQIKTVSQKHHCTVGVTAIHIENKDEVSFNGEKSFFMASTVKVPIALVLLNKIDKQELNLNRLIAVKPSQAVPGSGTLYNELNCHPNLHHYHIKELLQLMLQHSDNTASDILLHEIGGPIPVAKFLKRNGLCHIFVNRSICEIYCSASGFKHSTKVCKSNCLLQALKKLKPRQKVAAWKALEIGNKDTTTSHEMALLLTKLYQHKLLSAQSTDLLLTIMLDCQTGKNRIKKLLPAGTCLAHKTGSWAVGNANILRYPPAKQLSQYASDVGILTLPNHDHVALAIYIRSKGVAGSQRDATIAQISKLIYDYFN